MTTTSTWTLTYWPTSDPSGDGVSETFETEADALAAAAAHGLHDFRVYPA
jgi:hypothetical protein